MVTRLDEFRADRDARFRALGRWDRYQTLDPVDLEEIAFPALTEFEILRGLRIDSVVNSVSGIQDFGWEIGNEIADIQSDEISAYYAKVVGR